MKTPPATAPAVPNFDPVRRHWMLCSPAVAGVGFSVSWVIGLSVFSVFTEVHTTGAELPSIYSGHQSISMLRYLLTEGAPAIALAFVVWALSSSVSGRRPAMIVRATGLSAAMVSLAQSGFGIYLTSVAVPAGRAATAQSVFTAINLLDGTKMLLLAALAVSSIVLTEQKRLELPSWLDHTTTLLATALAISGVSYLFGLPGLDVAAWVSLPLLLMWVTSLGVVLAPKKPARPDSPTTSLGKLCG
jgi:glucan phosphoethanolaminetransferase (alkaline phosphatase superfamily)